MKAISRLKYGNPEELQLQEIDKPMPGDNEVLVKVIASSINSWDWDLLTGKPYIYRLLFGLFKPKFPVLGCDIAGIVEAIGKNVSSFKTGDEVFGDISDKWGGFAEYVCVSESNLTKKPSSITFEDAAAIPQAGLLAFQSLNFKTPVKKGDKILINGAGGGVGTFATQLAIESGAEVTCVDKADKLRFLRILGAHHVIDYEDTDFTTCGNKYDRIIDVIATRSVFRYKNCLTDDGIFVLVGGNIGTILQTALLGPAIAGNRKLGILVHKPNKDLKELTERIVRGQTYPVIHKIYPLAEVPSAFQYYSTGNVKGKIIIRNDH